MNVPPPIVSAERTIGKVIDEYVVTFKMNAPVQHVLCTVTAAAPYGRSLSFSIVRGPLLADDDPELTDEYFKRETEEMVAQLRRIANQ